MENFLGFVWDFRFVILYVVSFILFCLLQGKQWIKTKAYALMLTAKSMAKDGILNSGKEQEDWTVEKLYLLLMLARVPFITKDMLRPLVKKLYLAAKDYLDDGVINGSRG